MKAILFAEASADEASMLYLPDNAIMAFMWAAKLCLWHHHSFPAMTDVDDEIQILSSTGATLNNTSRAVRSRPFSSKNCRWHCPSISVLLGRCGNKRC